MEEESPKKPTKKPAKKVATPKKSPRKTAPKEEPENSEEVSTPTKTRKRRRDPVLVENEKKEKENQKLGRSKSNFMKSTRLRGKKVVSTQNFFDPIYLGLYLPKTFSFHFINFKKEFIFFSNLL